MEYDVNGECWVRVIARGEVKVSILSSTSYPFITDLIQSMFLCFQLYHQPLVNFSFTLIVRDLDGTDFGGVGHMGPTVRL